MTSMPLNITDFGVASDREGDFFHIFFFSSYNMRKLFLGNEELTEDISKALVTDDMSFITNELSNLMKDQDFMDYLEKEMVL